MTSSIRPIITAISCRPIINYFFRLPFLHPPPPPCDRFVATTRGGEGRHDRLVSNLQGGTPIPPRRYLPPPGRLPVPFGLWLRVGAAQLQKLRHHGFAIRHQKAQAQPGVAKREGEIEVAFARDAEFPEGSCAASG